MYRFFRILIIVLVSTLFFHLVSRSASFIFTNWVFNNAVWPDQKSYFWTLERGGNVALTYCFPALFSALILLRKKYIVVELRVALILYLSLSVLLGLLLGFILGADVALPMDSIGFTIIELTPLWLFLMYVGLLKVILRVFS
jgi:hypothetical protein